MQLLRAIYEKCNQEKLNQPGWLESVVTKYDGYDDVLIQRLNQKYCQTAPNEIQALREYLREHSTPKRVSQAWATEARDAMKRRDEERKSQSVEAEKPIRSRRRPPPKPKGRVSFSELLQVRRRDSERPPGTLDRHISRFKHTHTHTHNNTGTPPLPFAPGVRCLNIMCLIQLIFNLNMLTYTDTRRFQGTCDESEHDERGVEQIERECKYDVT